MIWRNSIRRLLHPLAAVRGRRALSEGIRLLDAGKNGDAVACLSRAAKIDPASSTILVNYGAALRLSGQSNAAREAFNRALALQSDCWPALISLASSLIETGEANHAISAIKKSGAIPALPNEVTVLLVRALIESGSFNEAQATLKSCRARLGNESQYWLSYAVVCQFQGLNREAEAAFRHLRSLGPIPHDIQARHARLVADCGDYGAARGLLVRTDRRSPGSAETLVALARVEEVFKNFPAAVRAYSSILSKDPANTEALTNLGNLKKKEQAYDESEKLYRDGLSIQPNSAVLHKNLADLLGRTVRTDEAIDELERCVSLTPNNPYFRSDLIFAQHYSSRFSAEELMKSTHQWGQRHAKQSAKPIPAPHIGKKERLRIGLLSGSFRQHPVGFLALPGLEKLDPDRFTLNCYANQSDGDHYTERFKAISQRWRPIAHLNDRDLETVIRDDRIDILLEMSGHASGHRLPVVAKRVAPVQVKWVGGQYNTLGIKAIDYFLSDPVESPPDHNSLYCEAIYRLPDVCACYEPPSNAPSVAKLPAGNRGDITFGSLNKVNKLNLETIALWSRCLNAVAGSRLILQSDSFAHTGTVQRTKDLFHAHGIDAHRIECRDFTPHPDLFKTYHHIDIALDPHPYSGCLTTCEAMWMGVPVVTLPGPAFGGRHSASFLTAAGLPDWIASDVESYVEVVVQKSKDIAALSALRENLRQNMAESPLCDAARFSKNLARALEDMWTAKTNISLSA